MLLCGVQGLLESAPQAVLQVYIGLINGFTPALAGSACLSVASLGVAMATSDRRGLRNHAMQVRGRCGGRSVVSSCASLLCVHACVWAPRVGQADKKDVRMPVLSPHFLSISWFRTVEALSRLLIASLLAYTIHLCVPTCACTCTLPLVAMALTRCVPACGC